MSHTVSDCHKFTHPYKFHKLYLWLCVASLSCFWIMATAKAASAQTRTSGQPANSFRIGLGSMLPVPKSPTPGSKKKPGWQQVPPPPTVEDANIAVAPANNPLSTAGKQIPAADFNQQENSFIQEQLTGKKQRLATQQPSNTPLIAAGNNNSDSGLGLFGKANNQQNSAPGVPTFNQLLNSQGQRRVTNPGNTGAPTFNQMFNAQAPGLPPLPGGNRVNTGTTTGTPTFNQILNNQTAPNSFNNTQVQEFAAPTFNQSQAAPLPQLPNNNGMQSINGNSPTAAPNPRIPTAIDRKGSLISSSSLREPYLRVEGVYLTQGGDTSARARLTGVYPITPQVLFGATVDVTSEDNSFDDSRGEGININELYFATSLTGLPNLRFVVGQLDLTSYFDRNSFAKDGASQFFNPVFQTNPALSSTGIASRTGLLVNWSVTDNIEAKGAIFSSSDKISDFSLDGFAGEIAVRYGNAIIRGTYASNRDSGNNDSFRESFGIARGDSQFGTLEDDREEAYGINAEVFIPNLKLGLFGRYGRYENRDLGKGADTYVIGASLLDVFTPDDRLGLAYGRELSNESLSSGKSPDVMELYYDFKFLPNLRLGFTVQGRDEFEETVVGIRVKSEFDVTPRGRNSR